MFFKLSPLYYSNSLPLSYLYVSITFSSLIYESYPCVLRQCFVTNMRDQNDLLSAVHHFTLYMGSSIQTVKVYVKRPNVRHSKPCASLANAVEAIIWTFC